MHSRYFVFGTAAAFLLISAGVARAQVTTATFYGIVIDPSGAAIAGAPPGCNFVPGRSVTVKLPGR